MSHGKTSKVIESGARNGLAQDASDERRAAAAEAKNRHRLGHRPPGGIESRAAAAPPPVMQAPQRGVDWLIKIMTLGMVLALAVAIVAILMLWP